MRGNDKDENRRMLNEMITRIDQLTERMDALCTEPLSYQTKYWIIKFRRSRTPRNTRDNVFQEIRTNFKIEITISLKRSYQNMTVRTIEDLLSGSKKWTVFLSQIPR
jgi:hypothetical protein